MNVHVEIQVQVEVDQQVKGLRTRQLEVSIKVSFASKGAGAREVATIQDDARALLFALKELEEPESETRPSPKSDAPRASTSANPQRRLDATNATNDRRPYPSNNASDVDRTQSNNPSSPRKSTSDGKHSAPSRRPSHISLVRTRSQSPIRDHAFKYCVILPFPEMIPIIIGKKGWRHQEIYHFAGLVHLSFFHSDKHSGPLAELIGSVRAIKDGLRAIADSVTEEMHRFTEEQKRLCADVGAWTVFGDEFLEDLRAPKAEVRCWPRNTTNGQMARPMPSPDSKPFSLPPKQALYSLPPKRAPENSSESAPSRPSLPPQDGAFRAASSTQPATFAVAAPASHAPPAAPAVNVRQTPTQPASHTIKASYTRPQPVASHQSVSSNPSPAPLRNARLPESRPDFEAPIPKEAVSPLIGYQGCVMREILASRDVEPAPRPRSSSPPPLRSRSISSTSTSERDLLSSPKTPSSSNTSASERTDSGEREQRERTEDELRDELRTRMRKEAVVVQKEEEPKKEELSSALKLAMSMSDQGKILDLLNVLAGGFGQRIVPMEAPLAATAEKSWHDVVSQASPKKYTAPNRSFSSDRNHRGIDRYYGRPATYHNGNSHGRESRQREQSWAPFDDRSPSSYVPPYRPSTSTLKRKQSAADLDAPPPATRHSSPALPHKPPAALCVAPVPRKFDFEGSQVPSRGRSASYAPGC
ncbi:hypothetical protein RQP46_000055 [Phenoliferia psychrophenolica]